MSSHELVSSFEKLEMFVGEDSNENHGTQSDTSSSIDDALQVQTCNTEHGTNFIDDADKAYIILLNVFCYLSTKDLLTAVKVCKLWNLVGSDKKFWKRISLNNCIVHDIDVMVQILEKYETEILYLRRINFFKTVLDRFMIVYNRKNRFKELDNIFDLPNKWKSLCEALTKITSLTEITVEECTSNVVNLLAKGAPQLKSLSVYGMSKGVLGNEHLDLTFLKNMRNLKTLKLQSSFSRELIFDETFDKIELNLTTLTITRAINLSCIEHILPSALLSLELGECHSLSLPFFEDVLPKLINLTRLRLEMCLNTDLTIKLVEGVSKLPNLGELELINFGISGGFEKAIAKCINLKSLLIIPSYKEITKHLHPTVNSLILSGVSKLKNSLQVFVWVVTRQMFSIENASGLKLKIGQNPVNVRMVGKFHNDMIPFLFKSGVGHRIDFISLNNVESTYFPYLKCKIFFKTYTSSTWKISLHNISM